MDDKFFKEYKAVIKDRGIPGLKMNAPLTANTLIGDIGLELEIEGRSLPRDGSLERIVGPKSKAMWTAVADGSLRGEAREYVLSVPCLLEEVDELVSQLYATFAAMSSVLDLSNRCSTHVHINMRGKTVNYVTSVIALWVMFEDIIVRWCGEERVSNHFCLTAKQASASLLPTWDSYLRTGAGIFDRNNLKYCALNVLPIFDRGSIEMRCGPLPTTPIRVIAWAQFCHALVQYACRHFRNPQDIAHAVSERGATAILRDICATGFLPGMYEEIINLAGAPGAIDTQAIDGFRRAQGIVMGHPWEQWLALIEREFVPDPFRGSKKGNRIPPRRAPADPDEQPEEGGADNNRLAEAVAAFERQALRGRDEVAQAAELAQNRPAPQPLRVRAAAPPPGQRVVGRDLPPLRWHDAPGDPFAIVRPRADHRDAVEALNGVLAAIPENARE